MANSPSSNHLVSFLRRSAKKVLGATPFVADAEQHAFLASYPRSGNTWLRCVLFHYTTGRAPRNLAEIDLQIPDEHTQIAEKRLMTEEGPDPHAPRIVKTHALFRVDRGYRRAVHIVRDPRHVIPSFYRYSARKRAGINFEDFAENCVLGSRWPGSWHSHTNSWMMGAQDRLEDFNTLRYEDLVTHNQETISALASSLGLRDVERLSALLAQYDLEKMRGLEVAGNRSIEPAYSENGRNFIGTGKAPKEQFSFVHDLIKSKAPHWKPVLDRLGYLVWN